MKLNSGDIKKLISKIFEKKSNEYFDRHIECARKHLSPEKIEKQKNYIKYINKKWKKYEKCKMKKILDEESLDVIGCVDYGYFHGVEWTEIHSIDHSSEVIDPRSAEILNKNNTFRAFSPEGYDEDINFFVVSNPEDTEIIFLGYHSD